MPEFGGKGFDQLAALAVVRARLAAHIDEFALVWRTDEVSIRLHLWDHGECIGVNDSGTAVTFEDCFCGFERLGVVTEAGADDDGIVLAGEFHHRADVAGLELSALHRTDDEVLTVALNLVGDGGGAGDTDEVGTGPERSLSGECGRTGVGAAADNQDFAVVALVTLRFARETPEVTAFDDCLGGVGNADFRDGYVGREVGQSGFGVVERDDVVGLDSVVCERPVVSVQPGGNVDRKHRGVRVVHRRRGRRNWLAEVAADAGAEHRVDNEVGVTEVECCRIPDFCRVVVGLLERRPVLPGDIRRDSFGAAQQENPQVELVEKACGDRCVAAVVAAATDDCDTVSRCREVTDDTGDRVATRFH